MGQIGYIGHVNNTDVTFVAEMSSRYHRRRAAFLDRVNLSLTFFSLVAGTGAFVSLFGTSTAIAKVATLAITFASIIQIVYRPEACSNQHKAWLGRWLDMLTALRAQPSPEGPALERWIREIGAIERECVGEMRALQADCYNRTVRALNLDIANNYRLRWYHRIFLQIVSFEHAFER